MAYFCQNCGRNCQDGNFPGSGWITFFLCFLYIIPAIIYSVWRRSKGRVVCPYCRKPTLIHDTSPAAVNLKKLAPSVIDPALMQATIAQLHAFYMQHGMTPPPVSRTTPAGETLQPAKPLISPEMEQALREVGKNQA